MNEIGVSTIILTLFHPFQSIAFPFHSLKPEKETKTASGTAVIN